MESPEFQTLYVGDSKDDDGKVIDSLVQEVDRPAEPQVEAIHPAPLERPKPLSRMFSGTLVFDQSYTNPIQIATPDKNRLHFRIDGYSYAATPGQKDYVLLADENGKTQAGSSSMATRLRHGKGYTLDDCTGAIWVLPGPITTDNFEITWVTVTS